MHKTRGFENADTGDFQAYFQAFCALCADPSRAHNKP
jgi:hypothetical protein